MKKIISLLLASAMVLALILAAVISVSASVEGNWNVYGPKSAYESEEKLSETSIPGYEYSSDGLHMIPSKWTNMRAWGIAQTKEQIDLRQGVYMEVRVDNFTYSGDKWFGFNIWEERIDEFPHEEDNQAIGYEMLIRLDDEKNIGLFQLNWHENPGESLDSMNVGNTGVKNEFDDNGCPIYKLYITWDEATGYNVSINGSDLGAAFNKRFTDFFDGPDNDGKAYVSFSLQTGAQNGTIECTVLKFGTSPEKCEKPMGDDRAAPINNNVDFAPIADPSTVPEGEPAVRLNGSREDSDIRRIPSSTNNCMITVNDDNSVNVSTNTGWASVSMSVKPEVSYDVDDFPIMMMITRNFCTCEWSDDLAYCECLETPTVITMAGEAISEDEKNRIQLISYEFEAFWGGDNNMYLYYIADWSQFSGRINGVRMDIYDIKYSEEGRNNFDVCEVGFFRNMDEAKAYFMDYLALFDEDEEIDTEPETAPETAPETESATTPTVTIPVETTVTEESESAEASESESETVEESVSSTDVMTEENTEKATEGSTSAQESETSAPQSSETSNVTETELDETEIKETEKVTEKQTEVKTEEKAEEKTEAPEKEPETEPAKGGCGSVIGAGSVALVSIVTGAIAFIRKREE